MNGKINKWANLYDKDGNLIKSAPQGAYSIEDTEKLVDDLSEQLKKDPENEDLKRRLDNTVEYLYRLYSIYGNPHEKDIIEAIKKAANKDVSTEQIAQALDAVKQEIDASYNVDNLDTEDAEIIEENPGN